MPASVTDSPAASTSEALAAWQDALARARSSFATWLVDLNGAMTPFHDGTELQTEPLDEAVTGAELQLSGILDGLRQSHRTLMAAYDQGVAAESADAVQRLEWQRSEQTRTLRSQEAQLHDDGQKALTRARAKAARALFEAARHEWNQPRSCRGCGGPIVVGAVWRPTTFTCPACNTRTTFEPAPLTDRFYTGPSLEAICAEHALTEWDALRAAQRRFTALQHPLPDDFAPFQTAARAWATTLATLYGELHPSWGKSEVERATTSRTRDALGDASSRDASGMRVRFAEGAGVAAGGDLAKLMEWAQKHVAISEMPELVSQLAACVHEHGDRTTAWQVIALQHHVERITQDRDTWMRDRLAQLDAELRQR